MTAGGDRPILFVDVDGVLSLFGWDVADGPPGPFHWVDGIAHCIPRAGGERLARLAERYDLVWATGWEEKANEYLPFVLELPFRDLPCLTFDGRVAAGSAHWKLEAIEAHAGDRPAAWIDDHLDDGCRAWADARAAPTLLVQTSPATGLTEELTFELLAWASALPAP